MKKLFSLVLCVALIAMCMGATAFAAEKDNYVIGALMKQNADTFVKNISDAIVAHANELGNVTLDMQDAEGDINKQLEQAETMLTKGVDAVILNAVDVEGSAPIVDLCLEAGVPVIECNTLTNNSADATCYVGSDDVDAGRIQAEFLKGVLADDAKVCYMMGPIGVSPQIYRLEGITKYLFDETHIEVLQSQTANWKRDEAYAPVGKNLGSLVVNEETGELEIGDMGADAQVNLARGVVVTNAKAYPMDEESAKVAAEYFGPDGRHGEDYAYYYNNIKANVAKRVAAYQSKTD